MFWLKVGVKIRRREYHFVDFLSEAGFGQAINRKIIAGPVGCILPFYFLMNSLLAIQRPSPTIHSKKIAVGAGSFLVL